MKFDKPASLNPIDQLKIVGKPVDRIDGPLKTTGQARYAYEQHDVVPNQAYGYVVGAAIAKGRIRSIDLSKAKAAPGILAIVTADNAGKLGKGKMNTAKLLGGPEIDHYHQAIAVVVAESFEQARAAASLVHVDYETTKGRFDLKAAMGSAKEPADEANADKTLCVRLFQGAGDAGRDRIRRLHPRRADQLRRAMAAIKFTGGVGAFKTKLVDGMVARGYELEFVTRTFSQLEEFGPYAFPEKHAASFAHIAMLRLRTSAGIRMCSARHCSTRSRWGSASPPQIVCDARDLGVAVRSVRRNASR